MHKARVLFPTLLNKSLKTESLSKLNSQKYYWKSVICEFPMRCTAPYQNQHILEASVALLANACGQLRLLGMSENKPEGNCVVLHFHQVCTKNYNSKHGLIKEIQTREVK